MRTLEGKTALACGASRGIGLACATEFARQGARVVLAARSEASLRRAQESLEPGDHELLAVDFQDPREVRRSAQKLVDRIGAIQILLNNSGGPPSGPILEAPLEAFEAAFASHLVSCQALAQVLVPGMKESGYGRIINIISTSVKQPIRGLGVSNTVRGAVASWAKTLSAELAPLGITVNNLLPGATRTDRLIEIISERSRAWARSEREVEEEMRREIPAGRFAAPEEIAAAAAFLASPSASYITGASLQVDGGRTLAL